jgi:RHS repeat-associated protein
VGLCVKKRSPSPKKFRKLGEKVFELVNHLGNIISTISDRKLMHEDLPNNPGVVHHYTAEILSVHEQYAYGMNMPGRSFSVEEYRYGFNGKENQDELMADNSSQDFGARMYDARVGRWWGMDPMKDLFKGITPYRFGLNNPIRYIDVGGGFEIDAAIKSKYKKFDTYLQNISKVYHSKPDEFKKIFKAMSQLSDQEIERMLTYGDGPRIGVNTKNGGGYSRTPEVEAVDDNGKTIVIQSPIFYIDIQVLEAFEKDENFDIAQDVADELDLEVSIFHESVHWGDQKDGKTGGKISYGGKNYNGERGNLFEELAYGQKLDSKDLLPYVKKNRQDQISELSRVRFNSDLAKTLKGVNKSFSAPVSTKRNVTRYKNVRNL